MKDVLIAPCGTHCGFCLYYKKERMPSCSGCGVHKGQPFWGDCKLYGCTRDHEVEHCGLCTEFPCDQFVNQYDPEHGQRSAFTRAGLLLYRKKAGTEKYRKMVKKLKEEHKSQGL
ncbi:MAG: DUF3795 domain-containing protein [Candidatus Bathyarchaeota archaeon]|nr:MAG: DUF3795 domain-containing protein [Candidatus Bathyarchaeota archaeon]